MICKDCKFENKEGAAFCANCGKPLEVESASAMEPIENDDEKTTIIEPEEKKEEVDNSEENTTVLTSKAPVSPAPAAPAPAPQGFNQGPKPVTPMGMPGAPMGMPGAPMGMPPMNNAQPAPAGKPGKAPKAPKTPKAAKPAKAKKSGGTIAYIVISIILILGLAGVGVWGYFHYTDKIDKLNKEKDTMEETLTADYEAQISDLNSEIDTLETSVTDLEASVTDYETQVSDLQLKVDAYATFDTLIAYTIGSVPQGSTTFYASNNIVYLTDNTAEIKVFYADLEGTVYFELADSSVATAEWGETWENDETTATLYINPVASGYTTVKITNTTDDQVIELLVFVE